MIALVTSAALCRCRWGHPLTPANVRERPDGRPRCLSCARKSSREAMARWRAKARAKARIAGPAPRPRHKEYKASPRPRPPLPAGEKAARMCGGDHQAAVYTTYGSLDEALAAPCLNEFCIGDHVVVYRRDGQLRVWQRPVAAPDLARELRSLYPRPWR